MIQTLLFVSGLSTLFQSLFGTRLPSVVVGSYSYIIPTTSIVVARRYKAYTDPHEVYFSTHLFGFFCSFQFFFVILFRLNLISVLDCAMLILCLMIDFSEVHRDYERGTRCSNHCCLFPDGCVFFRHLEECCEVK